MLSYDFHFLTIDIFEPLYVIAILRLGRMCVYTRVYDWADCVRRS